MPQYRKTTVQKDTVQNGRNAEMGNVPIILSSRVTEWHDVTTRNNQLNKQLKDTSITQWYSTFFCQMSFLCHSKGSKCQLNIFEVSYIDYRSVNFLD